MLLQWKTWKRECPVFFRLSSQFYQMACVPFDKSFYFTGLSRNSNKWLLLQAIKKLSQWKVFWCLNSWSIEYFIDKRGGGMVVQLSKLCLAADLKVTDWCNVFSPCFSHKCSTLPLPTHLRRVYGFWWYTLYRYCGWTYIHTFTLLSIPKKGFLASILTLS